VSGQILKLGFDDIIVGLGESVRIISTDTYSDSQPSGEIALA
jgi:hypothetical protein